ncbi:macro domain-containing protein [Paratractidigestivibacter sp.]|uniref:macro domain-containing protein n=1 Tax=Paratractidigestivibacter sp. TaxID=2847316 RepID=UPI002AC9B93C|nr:macro domain-containing protein [Paratractidigestivibacter sp.]
MQFEIISADITKVVADAIVLPANPDLREGAGASAAIYAAAGRSRLAAACDEARKACGRLADGSAIATPAYDLSANYILHAVVPRWRGGVHDEYARLSSAYLSSLYGADQLECGSIAFPLLASGNNGFDLRLAFDIARESIEQYEPEHLERVVLVLYGSHTVDAVRSWGYEVVDAGGGRVPAAPNNNLLDLGRKAVDVAAGFVMTGLNVALDWLGDPKNQEEIIRWGVRIAREVLDGE